MMRTILAPLVALLALCLGACGDDAPDYRYRLSVEVETPEGLKTGSSVIEVQQTLMISSAEPAAGAGVRRRVRGEAVAVDLPGEQTLFVLLRSQNNVDWASMVYVYLPPKLGGSFEESLSNPLRKKGERIIPRMWPRSGFIGPRSAYPMMVTIGDEADPSSVTLVDPDDLAASFGEGVSLKQLTVEITNDPVTTGIENRLAWLGTYRRTWLNGRSTISQDLTTGQLAAQLSAGSFSTQYAQ